MALLRTLPVILVVRNASGERKSCGEGPANKLKMVRTFPHFSVTARANNFCDFLFVPLEDEAFLNRVCSKRQGNKCLVAAMKYHLLLHQQLDLNDEKILF